MSTECMMQVEIPAGSTIRYSFTPSGQKKVKYFQSSPMGYPGNYGFIVDTLAEDSAEVDVLVLCREAILPGTLMDIRLIGYLEMQDGGEPDEKVIAVPADHVDPTYCDIKDISDLPEAERKRIRFFYTHYKDLKAKKKEVIIGEFRSATDAAKLLEAAYKRYKKQK